MWRRRARIGAAALLLSLLTPTLALSQGDPAAAAAGDDAKKTDIPDKPKTLQKDEKPSGDKKDLPSGPSASRDDFEGPVRDPAEVKRLQEQIRALNQKQISKIDQILAVKPTHERKADMLFQKAELLYEVLAYDNLLVKAEWIKCLEAVDQGTLAEGSCNEPVADYTLALNVYKQVLQEFPEYGRLDEVIYRLGDGLMKAEKKKEGISFLTRLVKNYPQSKYLPDSHLSIAEFWFDQNLLTPAKLSYEEVLRFKGSPLGNYARYKLAWVLYNQKEFREAVNTFKAVIETVEGDPKQQQLAFSGQALNDLVVSWVEIEGGWKEARDYFIKKRDKPYAHKKLRQMASLYDNDGKNEPRIEIFEYLLADDPVDPKAPDYWEAMIDAKKKIGAREDWESSVRQMIGYFDQKARWWGTNGSDKKAASNARMLAEGYLAQLATEYHQKAQKTGDPKLYEQAAKDYALFLEKFPDSEAAYDTRFYYAEILFDEIKDYEKAANQYQEVIAQKPTGEHAKHCQFALIKSYEALVLKEHPESVLTILAGKSEQKEVRMEAVAARKDEDLKEAVKKERSELFKYEIPFVDVSDKWAEVYPKEENTPTVMFVAAEIYRAHGQYDKSVSRYEHIINFAPQHRYASYAGNSLLECHNELRNWAEIERWGRYLLDNKIFDVTPQDKLQSAIAYAVNMKAGDLQTEKKFDQAAEELLRLAKEWPDSDLAPGALFNAAAIYERGDQVKLAIQYYEELIKRYPKHDRAPEALFVMGAIMEARLNFERAAEFFERLGDNKDWRENFDRSKDAIYNAGVIREALEQWDTAIKTYEKFLKLYPNEKDLAPTLTFHIAELYEKAGNSKKAAEAYNNYTRKYKDDKDKLVQAYVRMGLIIKDSGSKKARKDATEQFIKAYTTWEKIEDEAKKKATKDDAAEARFQIAEYLFEDYKAAPLNDLNKLEKELTTKAELLNQAETLYFEIIDLRTPLWTAAGAYRIGQMYKEFSDALYNYPIPEDLPEEYVDAYRGQIDEFSFPLQEKALKAFQRALSLALELNAYNDWSAKSALEMSRLEAEAYPLTKQDGVEMDHPSEVFLKSDTLTMEDVKKRAEDSKASKANN